MVKLVKQEETKKNKLDFKEIGGRLLKVAVPLLTPFLCFIITEYIWRYNSEGILGSNPFATIVPVLLILNLLLFYGFWGLMFSLIGRSSIASYITIAASFIIGLANYYIMVFRNAPITASDFLALKTALAVGGTYSYVPPYQIFVIALFAIGLVGLNIVFNFRLKKMQKTYAKILIHAIPAVLCICVLVGVTSFISRQDIRKIIPKFNATIFTRSVMARDDGLLLSFVSTIQYTNVDKPDHYSEDTAKKILANNEDDSVWKTSKINNSNPESKTFNTKVKNANIVVIMNECFSDIGVLGGLQTNMDYMPYTRSLMKGHKDVLTGYFYSSVIAGSTANTEFEFLTGDTMAFLPPGSVPYQQFIYDPVESMASDLKAQNYYTIGTHPYVGYGWNRRTTYPLLGFDNMRFAVDMSGLRKIRVYTDDQSYYEYLERIVFNSPNPYFSFNVTMQNHGGYTGTFPNFNPDVHMTNSYSRSTDTYLSLIKKSDEAYKGLIEYFEKKKEPTIVVMFGDHQPNDYVVEAMYRKQGKEVANLTGADHFERYKVPVLIWANYDIPEATDLLTSANYMGGMVTKLAGCKTSDYQNYLEKFRKTVPVISSQGFIGSDGKYRDLDQLDSYAEGVNDYKILNYYNIFGNSDK